MIALIEIPVDEKLLDIQGDDQSYKNGMNIDVKTGSNLGILSFVADKTEFFNLDYFQTY